MMKPAPNASLPRIFICLALALAMATPIAAENMVIKTPIENPVPGPGPNRMEGAVAEGYHVRSGDLLNLALSFDPTPKSPELKILPHDRLAISYHFAMPPADEDYRIETADRLYLDFRFSPELSQLYYQAEADKISVLSRAYVVQPEGTIVLRALESPMRVVDRTTSEIARMVREAYRPILQVPEVTVSVEPAYARETRLQKAIGEPMPIKVVVPDDGRLSLPLIDELDTTNRSVNQVGVELTRRYRQMGYRYLTVSVWFEAIADERHEQLRGLISATSPLPLLNVNSSGRVSPPLLSDFEVVGKTPGEISRLITKGYRDKGLERVTATVSVVSPRGSVVRILGEVNVPGVYPFYGRADLWGMISLAGGFTDKANVDAVRVLEAEGRPPRGTFSFTRYLEAGSAEFNPLLGGDELIYVPGKTQ